MINAVAEAQGILRAQMELSTVLVPLGVLRGLLDEIERLRALAPKPDADPVIVMQHRDIRA